MHDRLLESPGGLAAQADIGTLDVKPQGGGRSHKPRNLAKSVTVE